MNLNAYSQMSTLQAPFHVLELLMGFHAFLSHENGKARHKMIKGLSLTHFNDLERQSGSFT
jgi:hypothetical protein